MARVQYGPDTSQDRAAQKGGPVQWKVLVDLHAGMLAHHCMGREGRDTDMVVDLVPADFDPAVSAQKRPFRTGLRAGLAQGGAPFRARHTMAT